MLVRLFKIARFTLLKFLLACLKLHNLHSLKSLVKMLWKNILNTVKI